MTDLPKPDHARNMRIVAHSDQGGRPDGMQLMVHRGYAYVAHMFSAGFSVLDVRDAANPRIVAYIPAPANTWTIHLQTHDDLLLVIHAKDMFSAAEFADEHAYYSGALGRTVGTAEAKRARDWSARDTKRAFATLIASGLSAPPPGVDWDIFIGPSPTRVV